MKMVWRASIPCPGLQRPTWPLCVTQGPLCGSPGPLCEWLEQPSGLLGSWCAFEEAVSPSDEKENISVLNCVKISMSVKLFNLFSTLIHLLVLYRNGEIFLKVRNT